MIDRKLDYNSFEEEDESQEILHRHNPSADSAPIFETVNAWLAEGVKNHGQSAALRMGPQELTYNQLDALSNKLAHFLSQEGIENGDRVGICLERSVEMIACVMGILKAGAAYAPLDPNYPTERLGMMKKDADLSLLLIHDAFSDRFDMTTGDVVLWEDAETAIHSCPDSIPPVPVDANDIAYVIFTSGSTGRPKGIAMPHRALANLIEWQLEQSYFRKKARVLQYSSISFDVSFQEIATTLASGGCLCLISDEDRRDPRILLQKLQELEIERLFTPFVALRSMIEFAITKNTIPDSLKEVITAGEQLRVDSAVREFFSRLDKAVLDNQYGPSETHVISNHRLGANPAKWPDLPSIGRPLKNCSIYILDDQMQPVEEGETGELYLAGRNLAKGYMGRDDLTKEVFLENPFDIRNRPLLYKTGDLGSYNEDGTIAFLGRADHQIKIRGYRIEPGEINTKGAEFEGIAQCFTHATRNITGTSQLITYYVTKEGNEIDKGAFKSYLAESLPDYMVPAFVVEIERIPYTPSGKVDLNSLPEAESLSDSSAGATEITYASETEEKLALIWSRILGVPSIPPSVSFFDLGGDSLLAVTLFLKIEEQFNRVLPLSTLVQASTVQKLAGHIDESGGGVDANRFRSLQVMKQGNADKAPLFLMHGGAGNVLIFNKLAQSVKPDQPVLAFQWPGWDGFKGPEEISEIAQLYKTELLEAWPSGPYRLGGHCIGGVIALEVAKLLRAGGHEVLDPVLVSDAPNLHSKLYRPEEPEASEADFKEFKKIRDSLNAKIPEAAIITNTEKEDHKSNEGILTDLPNSVGDKLNKSVVYKSLKTPAKWMIRWLKNPINNSRLVLRPLIIKTMLALSKPVPIQDRPHYSATSLIRAIEKHPESTYDGDLLYLRSGLLKGTFLGLGGWWDDLFMGYEEICRGTFDAYIIGGGHNEVLNNPYALEIINEKLFVNSSAAVEAD
jgi:amino acid adenylation domain-containing protein